MITGLCDLDEPKAHTCIQTLPSKYSMCHQDECVIQQIMSCWASVGCQFQREMGKHKVNVIGGEGGLLWVLSYQSTPHNNILRQKLVVQGAKALSHMPKQRIS